MNKRFLTLLIIVGSAVAATSASPAQTYDVRIPSPTATSTPFTFPVVYVTDYGATCNGSTDDAADIQAAINAVANGGIVQFPAGTCLISTDIRVENNDITLQGYGGGYILEGSVNPATALKWDNTTHGDMVEFANGDTPVQGGGLKNIALVFQRKVIEGSRTALWRAVRV